MRNHKGQGGSPVPWCKVMRNIYFEGKGANIRKVKILPQTYFFGYEISSKCYFSRPDKHPKQQIISGNFHKSIPGTRGFLEFPQFPRTAYFLMSDKVPPPHHWGLERMCKKIQTKYDFNILQIYLT